jgi:hypothetical protein
MRAWRKSVGLSNVEFAGHMLVGAQFRLAPETIVLRHYIFRDQAHAFAKYATRRHSEAALGRGWHFNRHNQPVANFTFPAIDAFECLSSPESRDFKRNDARRKHYWQWEERV